MVEHFETQKYKKECEDADVVYMPSRHNYGGYDETANLLCAMDKKLALAINTLYDSITRLDDRITRIENIMVCTANIKRDVDG